jgi:hypothetical protein
LFSRKPQQVLFLAGVQRSGTNMAMDILERSFQTDVYHERDPRAFDTYRMRPVEVISQLVKQSRAPLFVIKSLCELQELKKLKQDFAPAKVVWVWRDYRDVVNSMLVSFSNQAKQVKRVAADPASDDWRGMGMSEETHNLVRQLVDEDIDDASAAALQWYFRNVLFFEQGFDQEDSVMLVRYEDLVQDPEPIAAEIFEFAGLTYSPWHTAKVSARSIGRRPAPALRPEIGELCEGLMQKFTRVSRVPMSSEQVASAREAVS